MTSDRALQRDHTIDGVRVHSTEAGAGEAVLLLHGMPTSSYLWRKVQALLAEEYRTVALDLPGFGASDKAQGRDLTLGAQAELVARFALGLDAGPLTLVGHDWGAAVAQLVAARFPGVPARLVLVSAHTDATWPLPEYARFSDPEAPRRFSVDQLLSYLREAVPAQMADPAQLGRETLAGYLEPWSTPAGMGAFFEIVRQAGTEPLAAAERELLHCWIPTLIAWGDRDRITPLEEGRRLAQRLPAASLEVVPGAGHLLPEEAPETLARMIEHFHRRTARSC